MNQFILGLSIGIGAMSLIGVIIYQAQVIRNLKTAARTRLPYEAMNEILDARAALVLERDHKQLEVDNALGHLDNAQAVGTKREGKQ
jgi:hypothetical protein